MWDGESHCWVSGNFAFGAKERSNWGVRMRNCERKLSCGERAKSTGRRE